MRAAITGPPRIVREGLWVAAGQGGAILGTLVGGKLLTTLLSAESYGYFGMLTTLTTLATGIFCAPLLQAALRFYPDAVERGEVGGLRALVTRHLTLGLLATAGLLLLGGGAWTLFVKTGMPFLGFVFAGAYFAADALRLFESGLLNAARRQSDLSLRSVFDAWAKPLTAAVAIVAFGATCVSVLLGYFAASAAVSLALLRRTVRGPQTAAGPEEEAWIHSATPAFLAFARPLIPLAILSWVVSLGDRYLLAWFGGPAATGIYIAGYGLASAPFLAANTLIYTTLRPVLYDAVARGDRAKERRTFLAWLGLVAGVMGTGVLLMAVLAPLITRICLGPQFQSASRLLPWIGGAYAVLALQQSFESLMLAHGKTRRLLLLQAIAAAAGLLFYFALIPRLYAFGAALGTLGAFLVSCAVSIPLAGFPRWFKDTRGRASVA